MQKFLLAALLCLGFVAQGQKTPRLHTIKSEVILLPGKETVCYARNDYADTRIGPPADFLRNRERLRAARTTGATFIIDYINFPDSARAAFQLAADIWASVINSPVPIRVRATWQALGTGVLGSAGPTSFAAGIQGATRDRTSYPIALAEKLSRKNLNGNNYDISARFNSGMNWFYGLNGATTGTGNREDLVSTVLHELGHGLGFIGSFGASSTLAGWGDDSNFGYPFVFDHYVENLTEQQVINNRLFANPSADLLKQLTSGALFFDAPLTTSKNNNIRASLYAPATYSGGSSISHLDEATYPRGNPNSAMTPFGGRGEVIQNPGAITLNMFADMGWKATSVLHEKIRDSESLVNQPINFLATVVSDTTLKTPVRLSYTINDTTRANATTVNMVKQGASDDYRFTIPASPSDRTIRYWISVDDNSNRTFSSPAEAPVRSFWSFRAAIDRTAPTIQHEAATNIFSTLDSLKVEANVFDDFDAGIDTVFVEWQINGVARPVVGLARTAFFVANGIRTGNIVAGGGISLAGTNLKSTDKLEYRIVARDRATTKNVGFSPATGFHTVGITGLANPVAQYSNDFNGTNPAADFVGTGFIISKPNGFNDAAIHSEHPYSDGPQSQNFRSNQTYTLLQPITISNNDPFIRFDEIALMEPGEPGSIFGTDDFYDYVAVEGSKDGGKTWTPFVDGWDARAHAAWLSGYNSQLETMRIQGLDVQNSSFVPTPALYRRREIGMLNSGAFFPGDRVIVRFRLFADQFAHGWGWTIDNLNIQRAVPVITAVEPKVTETSFVIAPNPSNTGEFFMKARFTESAGQVEVSITDLAGKRIHAQGFGNIDRLDDRLDLRHLPTGSYIVRLQTETELITKKVMIVK